MNRWWWSSTLDQRIVVLAAGFGLGPRVAAGVLAQSLGLELSTWRASDDPSAGSFRDRYRVLFNFGVVDEAAEELCADRKIWIDCLMWLRGDLPAVALRHDLILAEAFFETREAFQDERVLEIKPLVERLSKSSGDPSSILVSFGGIETPYTEDVHRFELPRAVLSSLVRALSTAGQRRSLRCFASRATLDRLRQDRCLDRIEFHALDRQDFLKVLGGAGLYVVQPGLYGPFEAFAAGIPAAICMPMSYTQMWQMEAYLDHGLVEPAAVFDRMRAATGPIGRDIEAEEPGWFARSSTWWQENVACGQSCEIQQDLDRWAAQVVEGGRPSSRITSARLQYVEKLRELPSIQDALAGMGIQSC